MAETDRYQLLAKKLLNDRRYTCDFLFYFTLFALSVCWWHDAMQMGLLSSGVGRTYSGQTCCW